MVKYIQIKLKSDFFEGFFLSCMIGTAHDGVMENAQK